MSIRQAFNTGVRLHWCKLTKNELWGERVVIYDWLLLGEDRDMYAYYANDYFHIERVLSIRKKV